MIQFEILFRLPGMLAIAEELRDQRGKCCDSNNEGKDIMPDINKKW